MPSSTKFPQNRDSDLGAWAAVRRRVHAGAQPLTPVRRDAASSIDGADRCLLPSASAAAAARRLGQPLAAPDGLAAAAAARPPQARPHAYAHASARAAPRRAALTARRRPPSRAIAVQRAERRRAARARPRRARRPRAPARESGRHSACGAAVETILVTFTSAIGGARNALAPPHRVRTSRRARRALASTRRPPPPVAQIAGSASARGVMSSTADLRSRSGRPVDDDDLCTAVAAVEPMRDLLEGLPHVWGGSPQGRPQFGGLSMPSSSPCRAARGRACSKR